MFGQYPYRYLSHSKPRFNVFEDCIPAIIYYIEKNFETETVQEIADRFNYSLSYIGRLFKKGTQLTLLEALVQRRKQKAAGYEDTASLIVSVKRPIYL